jgi:hypothetical protein
MTTMYTCSEARQKLASLLDKAAQEGEVRVRRKDGQVFVIRPNEANPVRRAAYLGAVSAERFASCANG